MAFGFGGIPDVFDLAVGADQKSAPDGAGKNPAHEFLGPPRSVGFDHFPGGIADQRKVQFLLGFELGQGAFGIGAGTQNHRIQFVEFLLCVTKLGRFCGSTGSVGLGKEEEDDALAVKIA